ncbi:MAG: apocytochrome f [Cyanobacteria bacterium LVE1205-1]|jgi:apocytochrome f
MKMFFRSLIIKGLWTAIATVVIVVSTDFTFFQPAVAYPFWAQQNYANPREATGRIVCANCHLASKPVKVEVPQSVLPDTVFKAVVQIPYDTTIQQVQADGSKGGLNVGAVVILPEGFKIAPEDRIPEALKEEVGDAYFQPYAEDKQNIVIVGPLPGEQYKELVFPVLSPDPTTDKSTHFGKYLIYVGGNRGRGQVYPTGEKSNNNYFDAPVAGTITQIVASEDGGSEVTIQSESGKSVTQTIPPGPELIVAEGDEVKSRQALTSNPNVGGFGQKDVEIVLQSSNRVLGLIAFFAIAILAQILLVLKKKQVEKVQAAEMNF